MSRTGLRFLTGHYSIQFTERRVGGGDDLKVDIEFILAMLSLRNVLGN